MAAADDLTEVAKLAGVPVQSDPELLAKAQQLGVQYNADVTAIIGADNVNALHALQAQSAQNPSDNSTRTGQAGWVADQVAGVAFAEELLALG